MKKVVTKGCCGNSVTTLEAPKPIRKSQINTFKSAGYLVPENMTNAGIFYCQSGSFVVTGSFGSNRFSIRCSGTDCNNKLAAFEKLLETATES